jgi:hypothetical protein
LGHLLKVEGFNKPRDLTDTQLNFRPPPFVGELLKAGRTEHAIDR